MLSVSDHHLLVSGLPYRHCDCRPRGGTQGSRTRGDHRFEKNCQVQGLEGNWRFCIARRDAISSTKCAVRDGLTHGPPTGFPFSPMRSQALRVPVVRLLAGAAADAAERSIPSIALSNYQHFEAAFAICGRYSRHTGPIWTHSFQLGKEMKLSWSWLRLKWFWPWSRLFCWK